MAAGMPVVLVDPATDLPYAAGGSGGGGGVVTGNVASAAADSGNPVKVGGRYNATPTTLADGQRGDLQVGPKGTLRVSFFSDGFGTEYANMNPADGMNNNLNRLSVIALSGVWNGTTWDRAKGNTDGQFVVSAPSATAPGVTQHSRMSSADTNNTVVKASVGKVYGFQIANNTASAKYLRFYNKASAPVIGTDTPVRRIMIPPNGVASYHVGQGLDGFTAGIAYVATGGLADTDATALAANDLTINVDYR